MLQENRFPFRRLRSERWYYPPLPPTHTTLVHPLCVGGLSGYFRHSLGFIGGFFGFGDIVSN